MAEVARENECGLEFRIRHNLVLQVALEAKPAYDYTRYTDLKSRIYGYSLRSTFGSAMPKPLEVFDDPQKYWSLLTSKKDVDLEDQFFDRKEAGHADANGNVSGSQISSLIRRLRRHFLRLRMKTKTAACWCLASVRSGR